MNVPQEPGPPCCCQQVPESRKTKQNSRFQRPGNLDFLYRNRKGSQLGLASLCSHGSVIIGTCHWQGRTKAGVAECRGRGAPLPHSDKGLLPWSLRTPSTPELTCQGCPLPYVSTCGHCCGFRVRLSCFQPFFGPCLVRYKSDCDPWERGSPSQGSTVRVGWNPSGMHWEVWLALTLLTVS